MDALIEENVRLKRKIEVEKTTMVKEKLVSITPPLKLW